MVWHENDYPNARLETKVENDKKNIQHAKESKKKLETNVTVMKCEMKREFQIENEVKYLEDSDIHALTIQSECDDIKRDIDNNIENESSNSEVETVNNSTQRGMNALKKFLETEGYEFSSETEFLRFYALPYVSDPKSHPSFKNLFTDTWFSDLRAKLNQFLFEHSCGPNVAPQLLQVCSIFHEHKGTNKQTSQSALLSKYQKLRRNYNNLRSDHHNLIGVAAELTDALEKSVTGQEVDLEMTLTNCTKIYPELFRNEIKMRNQHCFESAFGETNRTLVSQGKEETSLKSLPHFELDFRKIKYHLSSGSVKTTLLLLQALRWRITQSGLEEREATLGAYSRHDVLSLRVNQCQLLEAHLVPSDVATPHPLQQAAGRLVNTLASLHTGRDYLSSAGRPLVDILIGCVSGRNSAVTVDTVTTDMLLATLQKLSLRREQRIFMIEGGLVEYLVRKLEAASRTPTRAYTLEYTMALFMNLCLHQQARERCVPFVRTLLDILGAYLGNNLFKRTPYVTGTLYSLLANQQINQEAKRSGFCNILEQFQKQSTGEVQHQLECILKRHRGDLLPDLCTSSEEEITDDDTVELDLLEDELDADDPVTNTHGELCGDALLHQQYRQLFPRHGLVLPSNTMIHTGEPVFRPTTPQLHRSQTHFSNTLVLESVDSATEGENIKESTIANEMLTGTIQIPVQCSDVETSSVLGAVPTENSTSNNEEGENEFTEAFTSRPRIPRTPSTGKPP